MDRSNPEAERTFELVRWIDMGTHMTTGLACHNAPCLCPAVNPPIKLGSERRIVPSLKTGRAPHSTVRPRPFPCSPLDRIEANDTASSIGGTSVPSSSHTLLRVALATFSSVEGAPNLRRAGTVQLVVQHASAGSARLHRSSTRKREKPQDLGGGPGARSAFREGGQGQGFNKGHRGRDAVAPDAAAG